MYTECFKTHSYLYPIYIYMTFIYELYIERMSYTYRVNYLI